MRHRDRPKRNQQFFANIPSDIIIEIISRLPVQSIISCKCVCKSWLTILESREFGNTHLLKSGPDLAVYRSSLDSYKFYDFEDGLDLTHHILHYKSVTKFSIPGCRGRLLVQLMVCFLLCNRSAYGCKRHALHVCNPITRDYIELDCNQLDYSCRGVVTYGFGSSRVTGQHKVVRIFHEHARLMSFYVPNSECVCHVYTIGTGSWRLISHVADAHLALPSYSNGAFLNGNLHWPMLDFVGPQLQISCFDLETERFSTFTTPLLITTLSAGPTILGDHLCLSDNNPGDGIAIWLMKEYGVEKSWTKQFVIAQARPFEAAFYSYKDVVYPIKVFRDGDILLAWKHAFLFYSKKKNTMQKLEKFELHRDVNAFLYTPSVLSLTSFRMEKVISF